MSGIVVVKAATTSKPKITAGPTTIKHGAKNVKFVITGTGLRHRHQDQDLRHWRDDHLADCVDADHLQMMLPWATTAAKTARSVTVTNVDGGTFTKATALKVM